MSDMVWYTFGSVWIQYPKLANVLKYKRYKLDKVRFFLQWDDFDRSYILKRKTML